MRRRDGALRSGVAGGFAIGLALGALAVATPLAARAQQANPSDPPAAAPAVPAPAPAAAPAAPAAAAPAKPRAATPKAPPQPPPTPPEFAWVKGEMRINYRLSPTPNSTPLGVVTTGDRVGVLERKTGWARIVVGESSIGWMPENLLDATPPPVEHVAQLEAQVAELQQKLAAAEQDTSGLRAQVAELSGKDAEREETMRRLTDENRDLRAGERWPYLVTGASILGIGLVVGRFLRGGGSRRSYSRIR